MISITKTKNIFFLSFILTFSSFSDASISNSFQKSKGHRPHLDLEMTSAEYTRLLNKSNNLYKFYFDSSEDAQIEEYLRIGQKNLQWVQLINSNRTEQNKLSLSSEATTKAYPVNAPRTINFKIIQNEWNVLKTLMPKKLKSVIFENAEITPTPPVSDREFIEWMLQVDNAYQTSARYKLLLPYKEELTQLAITDVRPYLKLKEDPTLDETLLKWNELSDNKRQSLINSLLSICQYDLVNSQQDCQKELSEATTTIQIIEFKNKYLTVGNHLYQSYFDIPKSRSDARWVIGTPEKLILPFTNPENDSILNFLKFNIEDEFKWTNWQLELNFVNEKSDDITHIVFEPGTTPHVNDLAGSEITMDANSPLTEYDVQWTIRHEYGHVLGFPDCYLEFYDSDKEAFVAYQLDITNLMCSRRGHFQQIHFDELKRIYENPANK